MANQKENRMQVHATQKGHYGVIREPGDVFFVEFKDKDGKDVTKESVAKSTWLEPYDPDAAKKLKADAEAEAKGEKS